MQMRHQCLLSSPTCRWGGVCCRSDHGEQAGGNSTWALPTYRVCVCLSLSLSSPVLGVSPCLCFSCCLMLLPGSHCRSYTRICSIQRDAGYRDGICHGKAQVRSPHCLTQAEVVHFLSSSLNFSALFSFSLSPGWIPHWAASLLLLLSIKPTQAFKEASFCHVDLTIRQIGSLHRLPG
ncbi:hypothetical protein J3F83DRAFT_740752 [Trichoderma novae-zelandiae]